jgi:hypothetical protein
MHTHNQQATFPAHYREQRFGHQYGHMHFGLLDIYLDSETGSGIEDFVKFSIINYLGEEVMSINIPVLPRSTCGAHIRDGSCSNTDADTELPLLAEGEDVCIPFRGPTPLYKDVIFRFILVSPLIFCGALPLLYLCWLLFASLYYIFWVSEVKRREKIEAEWKSIKKVK